MPGGDSRVRLYDADSLDPRWEQIVANSFATDLLGFVNDAQEVILGGLIVDDAPQQIWYLDVESGEVIDQIVLQDDEEPRAANATYYATTTTDATLTVYERASGDTHFQHTFDDEAEWGEFTHSGDRLLVANANPEIDGYNFYMIDLANPDITEPAFTGDQLDAIDPDTPTISGDDRYLAFGIRNEVGLFVTLCID